MRLAVMAVVLLVPQGAAAFECKTVDNRPFRSLFWSERSVPYALRAGSEDAIPAALAVASSDVWGRADCTDLFLDYEGIASAASDINQIVMVESSWSAGGRAPRAVGLTTTEFESQTGRIVRADIELNADLFSFTQTASVCLGGTQYDLQAVLTHEFGHLIGLDHTFNLTGSGATDPTMAPEVAACESSKRTLEADDVEGVCTLYPAGRPAQSCALPPDAEVDVANQPFGCRNPAGGWELLLLLGLIWWRGKGCPNPQTRR